MRRILVETARRKSRAKRGGELCRAEIELDILARSVNINTDELLDVHEALEELAEAAPRKAELVKLRYFLGMSNTEAAKTIGIAPSTAEDDWRYAKAWLKRYLKK